MRPRLLIFYLLPLLFAACSEVVTTGPTSIYLEAADVTSSSAVINVLLSGDKPAECWMTKAFLQEDIDVQSLSEESIRQIVMAEGHAITLPCSETLTNLTPFQKYTVLLSWANGDVSHSQYINFQTLSTTGTLSLILHSPSSVWEEGATAGLFSYDREGTSNNNIPLVVSDYYVQKKDALFLAQKKIEIPEVGTDRFFIYYPRDENTFMSSYDYAMHSYLTDMQRSAEGKSESTNAYYWAIKEITPSVAQLDIELDNALSTLEFDINTSLYPGYKLKEVSLFDNNGSAGLAGEFAVDPDRGTVKPVSGKTISSVSVSSMSESADGNLVISIIPGDYSSCDMRVFINLVSPDGTNAVIPIRYPEPLDIKPGERQICHVDNLVPDKEAYPWYEPVEKRDFLGKCSYGGQNTYCIECREFGQSTISFDVKARGNLLEAKEPKYYGILLPSDIKGGKFLVMPDGVDDYEEYPSRAIPSDYVINVGCYGQDKSQGYFGVVAIYDADYNILWSYMIWRYDSGDPVTGIYYPGGPFTLMDRALGAHKGETRALKEGSLGVGAAYFEWGRKDPFPWYDQVEPWYMKMTPELGWGIEYALSHPQIWMTYSKDKTWFYSDQRKDLWGAENLNTTNNTAIVGHKTIYDPCPEGWRVCDYSVCDFVHSQKVFAERVADSRESRYKVQNKNKTLHLALPCPYSDVSVVAVDKGNGEYDYWPFHGLMWGSSNSWNNKSTNATDYAYAYWSNSNNSVSNYKAALLMGYYTSTSWTTPTSIQMSDMYTVRCQRED